MNPLVLYPNHELRDKLQLVIRRWPGIPLPTFSGTPPSSSMATLGSISLPRLGEEAETPSPSWMEQLTPQDTGGMLCEGLLSTCSQSWPWDPILAWEIKGSVCCGFWDRLSSLLRREGASVAPFLLRWTLP